MQNQNLCPLCGENNLCAIAANSKATFCWCQEQIFSDDIISQAQKHQLCICQPCAHKAQQLAIHIDLKR